MANYITLDGGTSTTRLYLVRDGEVVDFIKFGFGAVGDAAYVEHLKQELREGIALLLSRNQISSGEIKQILASGMITSERGLCPLPHSVAPCGIEDISREIFSCAFPEVSEIPFSWIRGVRTEASETGEMPDMMRGEETELMGLGEISAESTLYVFPGSHTKLIQTDSKGRIFRISTELTGEMIRALSERTILKESVTMQNQFDEEFLHRGYRQAEEKGLNSALFSVRILDRLMGASEIEAYSFFLGAIYAPEVKNILASSAPCIVIGGKETLRRPLASLLRAYGTAEVSEVSEALAETATAMGAVRIYETTRR